MLLLNLSQNNSNAIVGSDAALLLRNGFSLGFRVPGVYAERMLFAGRIVVLIDADSAKDAMDTMTRIMMGAAKIGMNGIVDWSFPEPAVEVEEDAADYQSLEAFLPF
jgi:hypothetical protein